jgi:hypothetical protein
MKKYSKILSCHIGMERPTTEYCEQLEAENQRLRDTNEMLASNLLAEAENAQRLEAENARLLPLQKAVEAAAVYIFFHDKSGGKWFTSAPTEYEDKARIKKRFVEAVRATGITYEGTPRKRR